MSRPPNLSPGDTVLAGEYAARLLEGEDLAIASRKCLDDPGFAAMVAWWDLQLAGQHSEIRSVAPPNDLWHAIKSELLRQRATEKVISAETSPTARSVSRWRAVAGALAIGCLLMLLIGMQIGTRQGSDIPETTNSNPADETQLIALLDAGDEGPTIAARIDPASNSLSVRISGTDAAALGDERAPVLWVIPDGGAPTSLGLLPTEGVATRSLTPTERALVEEGATLAVTYEMRREVPHTAPQGEVFATGRIRRV